MNYVPCRDRRFTLRLFDVRGRVFSSYILWLKHLVERVGATATRKLWDDAFQRYDRKFLETILASEWRAAKSTNSEEGAKAPVCMSRSYLGFMADGISGNEAQSLIEKTPPLPHILEHFPNLRVEREISAYETLHLSLHGIALLTETLIDQYGKQGELIAYDAMWAQRYAVGQRLGRSAADFFKLAGSESGEPDMFSAGLEREMVKVSSSELIMRVKECEWARYFLERHPRVGYLVACSTDEAFARGFHDSIRMKRTSTLMEGGSECDFRYCSVNAASSTGDEDK
jgi:hypothetical protein